LPTKNKQINTKPTAEEFLQFKPSRLEYKWSTDKEGHVQIQVPKFKSSIGKKFCTLLKKDQIIIANMDDLGSIVWKYCDGKKTVAEILKILETTFPQEDNLDQRLFLFIQQMGQLHYLIY
jgi:hypothetical protein